MESCIFCAQPFSKTRRRSEEHAAPKWCRELVPTAGRREHVFFVEAGEGPQELFRGVRDPFTTVASNVCVACNTGWMEEMEEWAKRWLTHPIEGRERTLRRWRQVLTASWAVKTALVWESVEPKHRSMPPRVAHDFHVMQRPGTRQSVWIGRYAGKQPHPLFRSAGFFPPRDEEGSDGPQHADLYVIAFAIGHFACVVFGHVLRGGMPGVRSHDLVFPEHLDAKLVRVWPAVHEVVRWPPASALDDADLAATVRLRPPEPDAKTADA